MLLNFNHDQIEQEYSTFYLFLLMIQIFLTDSETADSEITQNIPIHSIIFNYHTKKFASLQVH